MHSLLRLSRRTFRCIKYNVLSDTFILGMFPCYLKFSLEMQINNYSCNCHLSTSKMCLFHVWVMMCSRCVFSVGGIIKDGKLKWSYHILSPILTLKKNVLNTSYLQHNLCNSINIAFRVMSLDLQMQHVMVTKYSKFGVDTFNTFNGLH